MKRKTWKLLESLVDLPKLVSEEDIPQPSFDAWEIPDVAAMMAELLSVDTADETDTAEAEVLFGYVE
jgi:hypothetical protein